MSCGCFTTIEYEKAQRGGVYLLLLQKIKNKNIQTRWCLISAQNLTLPDDMMSVVKKKKKQFIRDCQNPTHADCGESARGQGMAGPSSCEIWDEGVKPCPIQRFFHPPCIHAHAIWYRREEKYCGAGLEKKSHPYCQSWLLDPPQRGTPCFQRFSRTSITLLALRIHASFIYLRENHTHHLSTTPTWLQN